MKKVKELKKWGVYENNKKEIEEYGFKYTIIHPDDMDISGLTPRDTDMEFNTLEECVSWIKLYK